MSIISKMGLLGILGEAGDAAPGEITVGDYANGIT